MLACLDGGVRAPNLAAHGVARVVRAACRPSCDIGDFLERVERMFDTLSTGGDAAYGCDGRTAAGRPRPMRAAGDGPAPGADRSPFDRQPPQDVAAEQSVLGGMLLSKDAIADVVEVLRPDDFYRPAHQTVYESILDLYGRGEPADAVTVSAELQRRGDLIRARRRALPAHPHRDRADRRERRLLRRDRRREGHAAPAGRGRYPDRPARLRTARRAARSTRSSTGPRPRSTTSPNAAPARTTSPWRSCCSPRWTRSTPSPPAAAPLGVPTGFTDLDAATNGLHAGQMIIVAGAAWPRENRHWGWTSPGPARSSTVWPAAIFSLEMSKIEIIMRLLSAEAGSRCTTCAPGR